MRALVVSFLALGACYAKPELGPVVDHGAVRVLESPEDQLTITVTAGSIYDPVGFEGSAYGTAKSIDSSAVVGRRQVQFSYSCEVEDCEEALQRFAPSNLKLVVQQPKEQALSVSEVLAHLRFEGRRAAHSPHQVQPTLTEERLRRFYRHHYVRGAVRVQAPKSLVASAKQVLSLLPVAPVVQPPLFHPPPLHSAVVVVRGEPALAVGFELQAGVSKDELLTQIMVAIDSEGPLGEALEVALVKPLFSVDQSYGGVGFSAQASEDELVALLEAVVSQQPVVLTDEVWSRATRRASQYEKRRGNRFNAVEEAGFEAYSQPMVVVIASTDPSGLKKRIEEMLSGSVELRVFGEG